jgi:hypothetical protein
MDTQQYHKKVAQTVMQFKQLPLEDLLIKKNQLNNFGIASLSLSHFLKSVDVISHEALIKEILAFQQITALGQYNPHIIKDAILNENVKSKLKDLKNNPQVISTFHFGSYRMINALLLEHDIPYSLIISSATITNQSSEFLKMAEKVYKKRFTIIDAESPSCVISMIKEIKKGNSLLIYLDGNIGAGGNKGKEDNLCSIKFLDGKLRVRKGAAYLSHISKVPIFSATCFLKNYQDIHFDFSNSISPDQDVDRETYALSTMQSIYSHFANLVKQYPEQWEAWFYLHKNIDYSSVLNSNQNKVEDKCTNIRYGAEGILKFNLKDYSLFNTPPEYYVLDKRSFLSYPLSQQAYTVLIDCLAKGLSTLQQSNGALVDQLIKNNLLIREFQPSTNCGNEVPVI